MTDIFFRFLQFSLGLYEGKEFKDASAFGREVLRADALHEDAGGDSFGADLFDFARRQTLLGVVFDGIQKLSQEVRIGEDLTMTWFGLYRKVIMLNRKMNLASVRVYDKVRELGFRCCILKGQGNALLYPHPFSRTPGDVDVWVDAGREDVRRLARLLVEDNGFVLGESINHVLMSLDGIMVELHSTPAIMNSPLHNHRLQRWLRRNVDMQCSHVVSLPDGVGSVAIPTSSFNVIYLLCHLYHHVFYEGVGLRQIIDYYLALVKWRTELTHHSEEVAIQKELRHLGLWRFCGAVMYVLHEVLGLPEEKMIAPMDAKRGSDLLAEILAGGNFGKYDKRQALGHGAVGHNLQRLLRDWRLVRYYPAEALSEPIFRTWHFFWRKCETV